PILAVEFQNRAAPYARQVLQDVLFDDNPTGTMTDYYDEISYGNLQVSGTVYGWTQLAKDDDYYAGGPGCRGILTSADKPGCPPRIRMPELIDEAVKALDGAIDFTIYDNDGPDGIPNSGDDDGFVDFIALVHPESGSECGAANTDNIWSHQFSLSEAGATAIETNDIGRSGAKIRIDSYVMQPAKNCAGTTIEIGVFCHEFGHAFGLPDLYDIDGTSAGVGHWDLMGAGNYGGDNKTPSRPLHMGAWSKSRLGWVKPTPVVASRSGVAIPEASANPFALQLVFGSPVGAKEYFLIENRTRTGFDGTLAAEGLLIWHIDEGRPDNSIECFDDPVGFGCGSGHAKVAVEQADGKYDLEKRANRGDAGDVFDGTENRDEFSPCTNPWSMDYLRETKRSIAVKGISSPGAVVTADIEYAEGWDSLFDVSAGNFGVFMAPLGGDVDGDGFEDLLVGEPGDERARLLSGASGTQIHLWNGVHYLDRFGGGIVGGNVYGDSAPEVIIGAWGRNLPGKNLAGVVEVYESGTGDLIGTIPGETVGAAFGASVAVVGRTVGDPGIRGAILVGAPTTRNSATPGDIRGRAYLFDGTNGSELARWDGEEIGDSFGATVADIGDINGDLITDFAIAAPLASPGGMTQAGRVYVYDGAAGEELFTLDGPDVVAQFGFSIAPVGNPYTEPFGGHFAVGAPQALGTGAVYVIHAPTRSVRRVFQGVTDSDQFGRSVAGGVNIDNLGGLDVAVGASGSNRIYVFDIESGDRIARLDGPAGKQLGLSVAILGDGDCDKRSEVAAGGFKYGTVYKGGPPQRTSRDRLQDTIDGVGAADAADIGDVVADLRAEAGLG
ncbi:MAG: M6 family metalloprotease domain-containing protein, partial [Myxococcales bacterium]|nr:M6 family metalloprotease domain-containing protein [Myxococcales bacterium]